MTLQPPHGPRPRRPWTHVSRFLRRRALPTVAEAERRAGQRTMNAQLRVWTPVRVLGSSLGGLGVVVAVVHWLVHVGWRPIPLSMGWQDLAIGYPTAAVLAVAAAVIVGRKGVGA